MDTALVIFLDNSDMGSRSVTRDISGDGALVKSETDFKLHYRTDFQGIPVSVENRKGSIRRGKDRDGNEWETKMLWAYGRIPRSRGTDGDMLDCYLGPNKKASTAYVVSQVRPETGEFDEYKVMLGFDSLEAARDAYLAHYDDQRFLGEITPMVMEDFREWAKGTMETPKLVKGLRRIDRRNPRWGRFLKLLA